MSNNVATAPTFLKIGSLQYEGGHWAANLRVDTISRAGVVLCTYSEANE